MKYQVHLPSSGHRFTVDEGETVLEAALRSGVNLPYGCRSGRCCTCVGEVLDGSFRYEQPPAGLTPQMIAKGQALLCQALPASDLEINIREVDELGLLKIRQMPCKVARLEQLSADVMRVFLKLPEHLRMQFFAGQYIDILQENGERRSFSIANAPHDDKYIELHIKHVEGGEYTQYIFERMNIGEILRIEGPLGSFFLREFSDQPIILMGGGTGFAPLKGIVEHALHVGLERPIHLFWGARTRSELYLPDLPYEWERRQPLFRFTPVLSDPTSEDDWHGETGLVHEIVMKHYPDMRPYEVYMGGSPAMVYAARDAFVELGTPEDQLYSDAFEFNSQMQPGSRQGQGG